MKQITGEIWDLHLMKWKNALQKKNYKTGIFERTLGK